MSLRVVALLPLLALQLTARLQPLNAAGYEQILHANRGHVTLVSFWATWCEPCREELPRLHRFAGRHHVKLITVSADQPEAEPAAEHLLRKLRIRGRAYRGSDPGLQDLITAVDPEWSGVLPALFVYGRNSQLIHSFFGEVEWIKLDQVLRP